MAFTDAEIARILQRIRSGKKVVFGRYGRGHYTAVWRGDEYQIDLFEDGNDNGAERVTEGKMRETLVEHESDFRSVID